MQYELITRRRMHNLRLTGTRSRTAEETVQLLGAVQSQDFGPAKWSLAQRTSKVDTASLDRDFADGKFLRTHVLRPTWHFVHPTDIGWMIELTGPRVHAHNAGRYRNLGLDSDVFRKSDALLTKVLRGGEHLTRKALIGIFDKAGFGTESQRLTHLIMHAELKGTICSGAPQGKQHTYALLEERAPQTRALGRDEALAELAFRYFSSHGPATMKDLRWWSSLTLADIRTGIEMAGSRLNEEVVEGISYWSTPGRPRKGTTPKVHLLQVFDEYIVGLSESRSLIDPLGKAGPLLSIAAALKGVVTVDGMVAGRWKRTVNRDSVDIVMDLDAPLDDVEQAALQTEADRLGRFLGVEANLVERATQP